MESQEAALQELYHLEGRKAGSRKWRKKGEKRGRGEEKRKNEKGGTRGK